MVHVDGKRLLAGATVLVTRAAAQAGSVIAHLERLGAEVLLAPAIEIAPPESCEALDAALDDVGRYGLVVFASANAVEAVIARLQAVGRGAASLRRFSLRIAAVGEGTRAALRAYGLAADLLADESTAEGLARVIGELDLEGQRVLLPRAAEGRELLLDFLERRGIDFDAPTAYRTVPVAPRRLVWVAERLARREIDIATFGSPTAVRALLAALPQPDLLAGVLVAAIGPTTAFALEKAGLRVHLVASPHTFAALVEGLVSLWQARLTARGHQRKKKGERRDG